MTAGTPPALVSKHMMPFAYPKIVLPDGSELKHMKIEAGRLPGHEPIVTLQAYAGRLQIDPMPRDDQGSRGRVRALRHRDARYPA